MKFLSALLLLASVTATPAARSRLPEFYAKPDDWFRSSEAGRITTNVLSWQSSEGSWPKNKDTASNPYTGNPKSLKGTFDNSATTGELRYLARAYRFTRDSRCEAAFLKGLAHILKAQYSTGGWPQFYPPSNQYHRHITFNDNAMVRLMQFLQDVAVSPDFAFVPAEQRKAARESFERGVQCILKCQIKVNGKLTVWCAQHDELDYSPTGARAYELASLSGSESVGILDLLMQLEAPSKEVRQSINAGAEWFEAAKITGIKVERVNGERVTVADTNAPVLWARFYDLETGNPFFSDRDGVKKFEYMQIGRERRNGYAWYGVWGRDVAGRYAEWKKKWAKDTPSAVAD